MNPAKPSLESINKKPDTSTGAFSSLEFVGFLDVFVHQARDVHNICIYHKQDVYAKLCLTSDPDAAVSTQIVNGGGRNPVFNENLRLGVRTIESWLQCEIWMLSKVKNYLEDQLLGFSLVALADVLVADGKLVQEFPLSATHLFHSPAGFIQLSLSYVGALPDVVALAAVPESVVPEASLPDAENEDEIPCEYHKIEFPDLRVVNDNRMMVSELFGIQCTTMEMQNSESLNTSESGNWSNEEAGVRLVESFSAANSQDSIGTVKNDIPVSSCTTMGSHIVLPSTSSAMSHVFSAMASPSPEVRDGAADSSSQLQNTMVKPANSINIDLEQTVVQQDIVDMYMKSMQQFTESLANMKLPMDVDDTSSSAQNGNDKKVPASMGTGSKVFYGIRGVLLNLVTDTQVTSADISSGPYPNVVFTKCWVNTGNCYVDVFY